MSKEGKRNLNQTYLEILRSSGGSPELPRDEDESDGWRSEGRCWGKTTDAETDFWFPDQDETQDVRRAKTVAAKTICYLCKVREPCLTYAIENEEAYGIWGGKTARERSLIRREWQTD